MKAVLDTNVVVSAILTPMGTPGRIVAAATRGELTVALSPHLRQELLSTLASPKVQTLLARRFPDGTHEEFVAAYLDVAEYVNDREPRGNWGITDPDDDWVVQCALDASADFIVSGDADLTSLESVGSIAVLTPAELFGWLATGTAPKRP